MLEEQRYLNRLKRFENQKSVNFQNHYEKYTLPEIERKKKQEDYENKVVTQRIKTYADYQDE